MRYIEWLILLAIGACGTGLANFIGYDVGFFDSLPGLVVLVDYLHAGCGLYKSDSAETANRSLLCNHRSDCGVPAFSGQDICDYICGSD